MLQFCGILLVLNTLTILLVARAGRRGRLLIWALHAEIVWFWLFFGTLALSALRRL